MVENPKSDSAPIAAPSFRFATADDIAVIDELDSFSTSPTRDIHREMEKYFGSVDPSTHERTLIFLAEVEGRVVAKAEVNPAPSKMGRCAWIYQARGCPPGFPFARPGPAVAPACDRLCSQRVAPGGPGSPRMGRKPARRAPLSIAGLQPTTSRTLLSPVALIPRRWNLRAFFSLQFVTNPNKLSS